jgi:hypothetical protein
MSLAAASRARVALRVHPPALSAAEQSLHTCWQWAAGEPITPRVLYDGVHDLLSRAPELAHDPAAKAGLYSVVAATYHCTWWADRLSDFAESLPNDMAEIDDSYGDRCLEYGIRAASQPDEERAWLALARSRLVADRPATGPDLSVRPQWFLAVKVR